MKWNAWRKRLALPLLWGAGTLIVLAAVFGRWMDWTIPASACYLAAFALSGVPILFRAVQALRFQNRQHRTAGVHRGRGRVRDRRIQ